MNPEITVLMSVYNGEKYLREAIESILNQTYKNFEFLIINDGSADSSRDIILSYNDPRIRLVDNEQNIGFTRSLNRGLKLARGRYIARMDADDISISTRLEKEVAFLNQNRNVGLVGTYYLMINEDGKVLHTIKCSIVSKDIKENILEGSQFGHGSVLLRAECIRKVGPYRDEFKSAQDYDLWLRISEVYDVANIPEILYKWRLNFKSISIARKRQQDKYVLLAIELAKERRQFGNDRLQTLSKQEIDSFLDDFIPNPVSQSRKENAQSYNFWIAILFSGKDYRGALKLLLKSFILNPFYMMTWILIFKSLMLILLPGSLINVLRFIKLHLALKQENRLLGENK